MQIPPGHLCQSITSPVYTCVPCPQACYLCRPYFPPLSPCMPTQAIRYSYPASSRITASKTPAKNSDLDHRRDTLEGHTQSITQPERRAPAHSCSERSQIAAQLACTQLYSRTTQLHEESITQPAILHRSAGYQKACRITCHSKQPQLSEHTPEHAMLCWLILILQRVTHICTDHISACNLVTFCSALSDTP